MNLFISNLPDSINAFYLEQLFKTYGEVVSSKVLYDRITGEHKGKGFIEMETEKEGNAAIEGLNGKEIGGKAISVEKARPRKVNIWS